jgi:DNA-binding FadR family transcriptional regulator
MIPRGLHGHLLDLLGQALTSGEYPAGSVLRIEELVARYGVSRTVVREAVRVLEAMRMVRSRPRVGTIVRPVTEWNLFDPQLIRWRLAGSHRGVQLRQLSQVRAAVEPAAAALAAREATAEQRAELRRLAEEMARIAGTGDIPAFVAADIDFHQLVLVASGNDMFAHLADFTAEVLRGRAELHLMPATPSPTATSRHLAVAEAVAAGDAETAEYLLRQIVLAAAEEVDTILDQARGGVANNHR